jgi:hypothetical protein
MNDPLDYSPHTLAVQHGLKNLREELLVKDFDNAKDTALKMIIELRLVVAAINDLKDRQR